MRRIIRRKPSGQAMGALLFIVGLGALLAVFLKAWPSVSTSEDFLSSIWAYISTEQVNLASLMVLKLSYVFIMGVVFLILGIVVIGYNREIFYVSGESVWLQCPYCNNRWKSRRAVGWAECPHCRKFIQPLVKKTET